jgi:uncharacterized protein
MVYVMYKDNAGYWRWRLFAANNKILADSGEGYYNKADCEHGINLVKASAGAPIRTQ